MFDRLFTRPTARARHRDGPLVTERLKYLTHLADQGASSKTLQATADYLLVIAVRLRLADRPGESIHPNEVEQAANCWAARDTEVPRWRAGRSSRPSFVAHATGWLRFLGRLAQPQIPPGPFDPLIDAFAKYLQGERGLSPATLRSRCWFLRRFLPRLGLLDGSLTGVTITQIDQIFLDLVRPGEYSRGSVQTWASGLRAFFRYAESCGWCRSGLAAAIECPRIFVRSGIPVGPGWDDVQRLLAATEGDRPADVRDRAILLLLAVYGLRAGEVIGLRLEDFDWEREQLSVTGLKTRRTRIYPLTRPVGDAVLRYLTNVRPRSTHREVFLRLVAPLSPLRALWPVVGNRLRALGLAIPHHGPHALRHACATHLLASGLSLKEIGDHLGHHDLDATRIYAKVDLKGLRQVADLDLGGVL